MIVHVKLFAGLRELLPEDKTPYPMELPRAATVAELLRHLSIPDDKPLILLINGVHATRETTLHEGDTLAVFPPVAGG